MNVLTVDPHEVNIGDRLFGYRFGVVATMTFARCWWHYRDTTGALITSRHHAARVQVVR